MARSLAVKAASSEGKLSVAARQSGGRPPARFKNSRICTPGSRGYPNSRRASKNLRESLVAGKTNGAPRWRLVVVGGHTRTIAKTQLVCDVISAFPWADWSPGQITAYSQAVCAQNGQNCDYAPEARAG